MGGRTRGEARGPRSESMRTRLARWAFNLFPCYRRTGGRIAYIAADWSEVRVRLPLNWKTRNYVGTIFGGSLYAAADPIYMVMLIRALGPGYEVWDKAAAIRFVRPGRSTLTARFRLGPGELAAIREQVGQEGRVDRVYRVEWVDAAGQIHAALEKTLHVRGRGASGAGPGRGEGG